VSLFDLFGTESLALLRHWANVKKVPILLI
jgi:hypothetical protein